MSNLNHGRPLFKVLDAGGGERVRTIDEELTTAGVNTATGRPQVPRCGLCGSTNVSSRRLRCARCVSETETVGAARKQAADGGTPSRHIRATTRARTRLCPHCYTELPVAGSCGFCG